MKGRKTVRIVLDALMTAMIVFEMLIQFTGEFLHEVVGFAFFATVLAHVLLSAKWVRGTARAAGSGKLGARRAALAVVGILLAVTTVVLAVSSIAISGILSSAGFVWPIGSYATWAYVHMISAYALCVLVVVHLAMHWAFLLAAFRIPYDPSRRRAIGAGVNAAAALGVVALGVTASGKVLAHSVGNVAGQDGSADVDAAVPSAADASAGQSESASSGSAGSGKGSRRRGGGFADSTSPSGGASASDAFGDSGSSNSASGASGICTLCRKQCPLSAPKCDKPYAAGLL